MNDLDRQLERFKGWWPHGQVTDLYPESAWPIAGRTWVIPMPAPYNEIVLRSDPDGCQSVHDYFAAVLVRRLVEEGWRVNQFAWPKDSENPEQHFCYVKKDGKRHEPGAAPTPLLAILHVANQIEEAK